MVSYGKGARSHERSNAMILVWVAFTMGCLGHAKVIWAGTYRWPVHLFNPKDPVRE